MPEKARRDSLTAPESLRELQSRRIKYLEDENRALRERLALMENANLPVNTSTRQSGRFILHGAESHISDILNFLPDMTLVVDLQGKVIAWNKAAESLTGVNAEEILGRGEKEYAIPFYGVRRPLLLDYIINPSLSYDPRYPYMKRFNEILVAENMCPAIGVSGLYIRATAGPLYDSQGRIVGAIELLRDISESRESQAALEASEAMYRRIVETATEGIWMVDEQNITTFVNSRMADLLACTPEEMMGLHIREFLEEDDYNTFEEIMSAFQATPHKRYDVRFRRKDGVQLWAMVACNGIYDRDGKYIGALGMFTDISDRKRWDQQMARLDRLNLVGEIAAGIGHEIRNPMTSVRGFLQMLSMNDKYQDDMEYFDIMIEELDRANSIISEFLNLTQSKTVLLKRHDINRIIEAVYPLIQAEALVSDKIALLDLNSVGPVLLDEKEIRQLIFNLSRNAMESMPDEGSFTIRTFSQNEEVILAIEDEGSGIDPEIVDRLGTPFFTTKDCGTGLGLAVCYGIASRHQAVMEFESRSEGTTVFIRFKTATLEV